MVLAALPGMTKLRGNVNKQTFEKGETILRVHEHGVYEAASLKEFSLVEKSELPAFCKVPAVCFLDMQNISASV